MNEQLVNQDKRSSTDDRLNLENILIEPEQITKLDDLNSDSPKWKIWLAGARPRTLPAAIVPVFIGTGVAIHEGSPNPIGYVLSLVVAVAMQVAVNYANDYSDGVRGSDENRVGPTRLVASRLMSANSVKRAAVMSFVIACIAGTILAAMTTWSLLWLGALCVIGAWFYTGGPRPYGYNGYGEVAVFFYFGLVAVMGTTFVQTQQISGLAAICAVPTGMLAVALLMINNIRDIARDDEVGKKTLAVWMGDANARVFFLTMVTMPVVIALIIGVTPDLRFVWLAVFAAPQLRPIYNSIRSNASGEELIGTLSDTGKLQLLYGLLFTIGLTI